MRQEVSTVAKRGPKPKIRDPMKLAEQATMDGAARRQLEEMGVFGPVVGKTMPVARAARVLVAVEGLGMTAVLRIAQAMNDVDDTGRPRDPAHMRWAIDTVLNRLMGRPKQQVQVDATVTDTTVQHLAALAALSQAPRVIDDAGVSTDNRLIDFVDAKSGSIDFFDDMDEGDGALIEAPEPVEQPGGAARAPRPKFLPPLAYQPTKPAPVGDVAEAVDDVSGTGSGYAEP